MQLSGGKAGKLLSKPTFRHFHMRDEVLPFEGRQRRGWDATGGRNEDQEQPAEYRPG